MSSERPARLKKLQTRIATLLEEMQRLIAPDSGATKEEHIACHEEMAHLFKEVAETHDEVFSAFLNKPAI